MRILLITFFMLLTAATSFANPPQTIIVEEEPAESDVDHPKKKDDKGHRMPPTPVFCTLDFDSRTVNSTSDKLADVVEYIVMDADNEICIATAESADALFDALAALQSGTYTLKFVTESSTFYGRITI